MPRFYLQTAPKVGEVCDLPDAIVRHVHVLRLKQGDGIDLFCGDGDVYTATLTHVEKRLGRCVIEAVRHEQRESPLNITLVQAISSGERMDFTLQKGVELGINAFQPVFSARSIVRLTGERMDKRVKRWQEIVISACEQSGRNVIPPVLPPVSLAEYLAHKNQEVHLLMSLRHAQRLHDVSPPPTALTLLAGCEGGWTEAEEEAAFAAGCRSFRLGQRVLRTETAALAAVAAMQTLWGDFA